MPPGQMETNTKINSTSISNSVSMVNTTTSIYQIEEDVKLVAGISVSLLIALLALFITTTSTIVLIWKYKKLRESEQDGSRATNLGRSYFQSQSNPTYEIYKQPQASNSISQIN